jgi:AraC-like DNA-binding protein
MSVYREYPPPAALATFVECFWTRAVAVPGGPQHHRVLPDGCLDIIVGSRGAVVVGAMTRALLVPSREAARLVGVRFRPGMVTAFLRLPAAALTDDRVPLDAVWSDGRDVAEYVGSPLERSDEASEWVARLAGVLTARLPRVAPVPGAVHAAVERIWARGGRVDVARLAASLGVSRQHLARRFAAHVGVSPKTLCRVARLREVLRLAGHARAGWAAIAADLGYYDQSHLVAEFRALTGLTPARWASRHAGSKSPSARLAGSLS